MTMWLVLIVVVHVLGLIVFFFLARSKYKSVTLQMKKNAKTARKEKDEKTRLLKELAELSLGLVSEKKFEELGAKKAEVEETIRLEKGRLTITEAELEAVDTRLRELEELKRELEVSSLDAAKELELLRSQEREVQARADELKTQVNQSMEKIDSLLEELANSAEAVERLTAAKTSLMETEKQAESYREIVAEINSKYIGLKKAYDALDIEYAQLYEKQQSME